MNDLIERLDDLISRFVYDNESTNTIKEAAQALRKARAFESDLLVVVAENVELQSELNRVTDRLTARNKMVAELQGGLTNLIKSCQAIIDNRHEDLGERDDVEPYLKNRLMIAKQALKGGDDAN